MSPPAAPSPRPDHESIARWAAARGLRYAARPEEAWFRTWEPYDTMAPATAYFGACTWIQSRLRAVVVEPWFAAEDMEPLERTLLGFATHPNLTRRAAARIDEHFNTRVAFLESPPPPTVTLGDPAWDLCAATFAASSSEASVAFHPRLRNVLIGENFRGHVELRAGGLVVHPAGTQPTPAGYERTLALVIAIVNAAMAYPR